MNWDPFQREVLAELGHVLYRQADSALQTEAHAGRIDAVDQAVMASGDDPMLARVAHAAGMTVDALQARFGDRSALAGLHGNPAAKRALWPRLRALRRQRG